MTNLMHKNATPMTSEELQAALEQEDGHLWRKLIVVHVGRRTIDSAVFLLPHLDLRNGAIREFVDENYGKDAVYFLVDVIRLGYEESKVMKLKLGPK